MQRRAAFWLAAYRLAILLLGVGAFKIMRMRAHNCPKTQPRCDTRQKFARDGVIAPHGVGVRGPSR